MATTPKQFEITYMAKRPKKRVGEDYFPPGTIRYGLSQLDVGQVKRSYRTAGYRQIKRVR